MEAVLGTKEWFARSKERFLAYDRELLGLEERDNDPTLKNAPL